MTKYRYAGHELTGIADLKGTHAGTPAVICCSGTTLGRYDDSIPPCEWIRVGVNEGLVKLGAPTYWVLADDPIVHEYAAKCPKETKILAMQQATLIVGKHCREHWIRTVESMSEAKDFDNGHQFFSRGTVLIGAIEMLRYMGVTQFYVFGLDCYRLEKQYYYDGRKPIPLSEKHFTGSHKVRDGVLPAIYVTDRLKWAIDRLSFARKAGLWDSIDIRCVDSPRSQQTAIAKMTIEEFRAVATPAIRGMTESMERAAKTCETVLDRIEESAPQTTKRRKRAPKTWADTQPEGGGPLEPIEPCEEEDGEGSEISALPRDAD